MNEEEAQRARRRRLRSLTIGMVATLLVWPTGVRASMVTEFAGGFTSGFRVGAAPAKVVTGPDGNLWFTESENPGAIAFMDRSGVVHEFTQGLTANNGPWGIAAGPDGNVWFTELGASPRLAYVDRSGVVHEFVPGLTRGFSANGNPYDITAGPDGHIWFTEPGINPGRIAYIGGDAVVHEFATAGTPSGITSGPGAHVWFTEISHPGRVGYIDGNGVVHEFTGGATTGFPADRQPGPITTGPDGHIWFAELRSPKGLAYIDDAGVVHELTENNTPGFAAGGSIEAITTGPDGNLWFAEYGTHGRLGRVNFTGGVPNGTVTEFQAGDVSGFSADAEPIGITTGPDGHIWFADFHEPGRLGRVNGPEAASGAGLASAPNSATLTGTVNPNGTTITDCHFEFGTSTAYGTTIPCAPNPGGGTSPVAVSTGVGDLSPGATYHFRVVASNAFGTSQGRDHAFTVPVLALAATTGNAMPTGLDSARLTGSVNPNATTISDCHFDYGTSSAYGFSIPCAQQVGRGNDVISVSADVAGLAANTIYHFRLVAANTAGTSAGSDQTYTTPKHVGPPTLAPVLSGLTVTPARFHPAGPGLTVRAVRPTSSGTIIRYRDTLAATTTLTVLRAVTGVRAGRRCVAQHGRSANRTKHCVLLLAVTRFTHVDRAGVNGFRFAGRVAGKALVAGRYTLQASATDAGLTSRPVSARFQILR